MRSDVLRWSGLSALLFAAAFILAAVLSGAADVNVYIDSEEIDELLQEIRDNEALFVISNLAVMLMAVFLVPILPGIFYSVREDDRPYAVIACAFMLIAAMFMVISSYAAFMLSDTGDYFNTSGSLQEAIGYSYLVVLGFHVVFFYGPPMGLGLLVFGVLALRSPFYHKSVGVVAVVGGLGGISVVGWPVILLGTLIWSLSLAWSMIRPRGEVPVVSPAPA